MGATRAVTVGEGAELVRRCRAGDGAAWEEIVSTYSRRIYNLAYRFTSRADAAEGVEGARGGSSYGGECRRRG